MKINQKNIFLICLIIIILIQIFSSIDFKLLPGPMYGGDVYRERGIIQSMRNTGHFWEDTYFENNLMFFPYLVYATLAFISSILTISVNTIMILQMFLSTILISFGLYWLGSIISKKNAIFLPAIFWGTNFLFGLKPSNSIGFGLIIFGITGLISIIQDKNKKIFTTKKIIIGIIIGLANLTHFNIVIWNVLFIIGLILGELIYRKFNKKIIIIFIKKLLTPIITAILVSLIYFLPIFIKYKFKFLNPVQEYCLYDINSLGFFWPLKQVFNYIIRYNNLVSIIFSGICVIGILILIINFKKRFTNRIGIYFFIISFIGAGHYLITNPLFNIHIAPGHIAGSFILSILIFQFFGIIYLIKKYKKIALILISVLLISGVVIGAINFNNSRWVQYAKNSDEFSKANVEFGNWLIKNTNNNDVFLANDEAAFMLNALSGRKIVMGRRTHVSSFVNVEKRYADGIAMLYDKDKERVIDLLKKYNVTYFYEDSMLYRNNMIMNAEIENYFKKFNINYTKTMGRLDPSTLKAPEYEILIIQPREVKLTKYNITIPVKTIKIDDQIIGILYKINI